MRFFFLGAQREIVVKEDIT